MAKSVPGVMLLKAIGIMLEDRGIAQVSINMVNYEGTPIFRAVEVIRAEARRYGVNIVYWISVNY